MTSVDENVVVISLCARHRQGQENVWELTTPYHPQIVAIVMLHPSTTKILCIVRYNDISEELRMMVKEGLKV